MRIKLENGEQFDGGDTQILQIGNLLHEPCIGATFLRGDSGVRMFRESRHMHLINHRLCKRPFEWAIAFPIIRSGIHDHALHGHRGILSRPARRQTTVPRRNSHAPAVGVKEDLLRIETKAFGRLEGAHGPVAIALAWLQTGNEDVPVVIGPVLLGIKRDHARRLSIILMVKEKQLDGGTAFREEAEVYSVREYPCPKGKASPLHGPITRFRPPPPRPSRWHRFLQVQLPGILFGPLSG